MNTRLLTSSRAALVLVAGCTAYHVGLAQQTNNVPVSSPVPTDHEVVALPKIAVTGSRISRVDSETPAPVVSYSMQDVLDKGYTNIGDYMQSLPYNTGSANSIYQTASFTRGAATANFRGLGANRFLTLINGRRAVSYALTNSGNRSVFDFNGLPAAAIESIDILKDGSSAIYGADAITGVLNIKLKQNYAGLSVTGYYGNTFDHDSGVRQVSIVAGATSAKARATVAIDFKDSNSNFLHDYGVSTTDYSNSGRGINQNSPFNYPANLTLTRAQAASVGLAFPNVAATVASWTYVPIGGTVKPNPTLADFQAAPASATNPNVVNIGNENRYNFAETYQRYPAYHYGSAYTHIEFDMTDKITGFAEVMFSDNFTYYAFTPGVINFSTEGLTLPVNSPYNPFGIALTSLQARTNFGPVRKYDTESIGANFLAGVRGSIDDNWKWETAANYGFNRVTTIARNAIRASTYQSALNGTLTGFVGSYLNPFGPSANPGIADALFTTSTAANRQENTTFDANVSGSLFDLPAGALGLAVGSEYREENLTTNPDTAAYLGSGGGLPLSGGRNVWSFYAEISAPIIQSLEVQLAARHERYSDFGNTTKPKFAAKYKLPENRFAKVLLRASYSESFQAPALGLLYASQTIAFSPNAVQDPLRLQDPPTQLRIVTGGNPNLKPEEAKSYYAGFVVENIIGLKNFSFSVDYLKFKIKRVIVTPGYTYLLSERGRAQFPNAIVRDSSGGNPGPILRIESVPSNNDAAFQLYQGVDFTLNYRLNQTRFGDFNFSVEGTRLIEIGEDSGLGGGYLDNIGLYNNPKWRGQANVGWRYRGWSAVVGADYLGSYFNDGYTAAGWEEGSYTVAHASVSFRGPYRTAITVGMTNLFNKMPPFNGYETSGFDPNTYSAGALGRFGYVRVSREF